MKGSTSKKGNSGRSSRPRKELLNSFRISYFITTHASCRLTQLEEYKEEKGHVDVPARYNDGLGRFCNLLRTEKSKLQRGEE
mmetsp:Transcript_21892/g.62806  ORF Transcript_21892/g.62806 Transcript_21892/m.62806 type:complete len:82 (-) Transcript_21892:684-929(-)